MNRIDAELASLTASLSGQKTAGSRSRHQGPNSDESTAAAAAAGGGAAPTAGGPTHKVVSFRRKRPPPPNGTNGSESPPLSLQFSTAARLGIGGRMTASSGRSWVGVGVGGGIGPEAVAAASFSLQPHASPQQQQQQQRQRQPPHGSAHDVARAALHAGRAQLQKWHGSGRMLRDAAELNARQVAEAWATAFGMSGSGPPGSGAGREVGAVNGGGAGWSLAKVPKGR